MKTNLLCPAVCARSWGALRTSPPSGCRAYHCEPGVSPLAVAEPKLLLADDLDWVRGHLATVIRLTDDERFKTALEALCTYMLAAGDRMTVAQLWAGVEAVFDVQHELPFRLATLTARLLADPGPACRAIFKQMKGLYGERSKIIHGRTMDEEKIRAHIAAAWPRS